MRLDAEREFDATLEPFRWPPAQQGFAGKAAHPVEVIERTLTDAPCQFGAWQPEQVMQGAKPHPLQGRDCFRIETARTERRCAKRVGEMRKRRNGDAVRLHREYVRGGCGRCGCKRILETECTKLVAQASLQCGPATEQPEAGAGFDEHAVRRGDVDLGTVSIRPGRERFECLAFRGGIAGLAAQLWAEHLRGCQSLAGVYSGSGCRGIRQHDMPALYRAVNDRDRGRAIVPVRFHPDGIQRQLRKPETDPEHACLGGIRRAAGSPACRCRADRGI
jgi:hypothetical protein